MNLGAWDRGIRMALGAAGLYYGISRLARGRRDWLTWALTAGATAKLWEGWLGYDPMYRMAGMSTRDRDQRAGHRHGHREGRAHARGEEEGDGPGMLNQVTALLPSLLGADRSR